MPPPKQKSVASINGKADVVTFRSTASTILREFYDTPKHSDWEEEKHRIVQTAADLIKNDVKCRPVSKNTYPIPDDVSSLKKKNSAFLPETLRLFLRTVFCKTIVQAACPRVLIAPIMLVIAVEFTTTFARNL